MGAKRETTSSPEAIDSYYTIYNRLVSFISNYSLDTGSFYLAKLGQPPNSLKFLVNLLVHLLTRNVPT